MQFTTRKHRQTPPVIIISLIDVLIVMLIFLMVTTTFKQQPAIKLSLPDSRQPKAGVAENNIVVTIAKDPPHFYLRRLPITLEKLQEELAAEVRKNPSLSVSIAPDKDAPTGKFINVMEAANAAGIRTKVGVFTDHKRSPTP